MTDPRVWLDARAAQLEMERAVTRAILAAGASVPVHPNDPRVGSPAELRGIPAIGRGCPGAIPGTRPDHGCR